MVRKRHSNWMAWGLALALALVLVGGAIGGMAAYGQQTGAFAVHWQSVGYWRYWWVGHRPLVMAACGPHGSIGTLAGERYSLGFVEVEVPHHGPEVVLWDTFHKTSTHSTTGR
jgi:hypothetical protein